ncbi:MAG: DUF3006 domain-containing protein [Clostridiaceae bacterium]
MKMTIDRFEGTFAVCEIENGDFANIPKGVLPPGAVEGSKLVIILDDTDEAIDRKRIKEKMDNLFKD